MNRPCFPRLPAFRVPRGSAAATAFVAVAVLAAVAFPQLRADVGAEPGEETEVVVAAPDAAPGDEKPERILSLSADYEIRRDGSVVFEQRFRLLVGGGEIKRGPVLNYLTAFRGPGGLVLDSELEILGASRGGETEPFRIERRDGFVSLYLGSPEVELGHGAHDYLVRGRMQGDWRRGEDGLNASIDLVGPLPALALDELSATVRLPEGVEFTHYGFAVTGPADGSRPSAPLGLASAAGSVLKLRAAAPLGADRSAFVNLSWPADTFAVKSQWPKVLRQHPRLPLAAGSAVLLLWALAILLRGRWPGRRPDLG